MKKRNQKHPAGQPYMMTLAEEAHYKVVREQRIYRAAVVASMSQKEFNRHIISLAQRMGIVYRTRKIEAYVAAVLRS